MTVAGRSDALLPGSTRPEGTPPAALALHVAHALAAHRRWLGRHGHAEPPELEGLIEWLVRVSKGQGGPSLDALPPAGHGEGVLPLLLPLDQAAAVLSVSESTVKRLVREGELPRVKVGGATRVRRVDLEAFVAQGCSSGSER